MPYGPLVLVTKAIEHPFQLLCMLTESNQDLSQLRGFLVGVHEGYRLEDVHV